MSRIPKLCKNNGTIAPHRHCINVHVRYCFVAKNCCEHYIFKKIVQKGLQKSKFLFSAFTVGKSLSGVPQVTRFQVQLLFRFNYKKRKKNSEKQKFSPQKIRNYIYSYKFLIVRSLMLFRYNSSKMT